MYSKIESVRLLVALMKEHNIRNVVLSPGGRNIPIVHSLEQDDFFTCYSVVDERSAAYFAIGVAQMKKEPVAICCTSSVAASNYTPGITEAFYLHIPLLVITSDRHPYMLGQMENQMIDQVDMYKNFCRKCVNLPIVSNADDNWYCQRLINEAILELDHHGKGPVQINIPLAVDIEIFDAPKLPKVNPIKRLEYMRDVDGWKEKIKTLKSAKRIMVVCGESAPFDKEEKQAIEAFVKKYNCVVATEHVSNKTCDATLDLFGATQVMSIKQFADYLPDLVISLGGNYVSRIKNLLIRYPGQFEHWSITEDGMVCDMFKSLTTVFECTSKDFFQYYTENAPKLGSNNMKYHKLWEEYAQKAKLPEFAFSNAYAIENLAKRIPKKSLMHLGILNATRVMEHCEVADGVEAYSNIGAFGIDGSMSTFMGESVASGKLSFLVIGDLSFFYDMNALQIKHVDSNVRIMLINNSGAAEFHFFVGRERIPSINRHIAAEHGTSAKGWVESRGFKYLSAKNEQEYQAAIEEFVNPKSKVPIVMEVFTDKETDANNLKQFYRTFK